MFFTSPDALLGARADRPCPGDSGWGYLALGGTEEEEPKPCPLPLLRPDGRTYKQAWLFPLTSSSSFTPHLLPRFVPTPSALQHLSSSSPPNACPLPPCCGYTAGGEPEEADSGRRPYSAGGHQPGKRSILVSLQGLPRVVQLAFDADVSVKH